MFSFFSKTPALSLSEAVSKAQSDPSIRLIDVRSPREYQSGHLPGSLNLPLDQIEQLRQLVPQTDAAIYVCCASGARSAMAERAIRRMGYTNVSDIGGLMGYSGRLSDKRRSLMKKNLLLTGLIALPLLLSACAPGPAASPSPSPQASQTAEPAPAPAAKYRALTAEAAKERMDSGDPVIVLDVREEDEYASGHIPGALLLPLGKIAASAAETLPDKSAEILVYCRSGNRSRQAANQLISLGYSNVYDFGGISSWPFGIVTE